MRKITVNMSEEVANKYKMLKKLGRGVDKAVWLAIEDEHAKMLASVVDMTPGF